MFDRRPKCWISYSFELKVVLEEVLLMIMRELENVYQIL